MNILLWIIAICGAIILFVGALGVLASVLYEIDKICKRIKIEKYLREAEERREGE